MTSPAAALSARLRAEGLAGGSPLVLGVGARLARRLGASPLVIRVGFVLATLAAGWGLLLYLGAWLVLVGRPEPPARPVTLRHNLGVMAATAMQLVFAQQLFGGVQGDLLWPAALVGFALTLAEPDASDRNRSGGWGRVAAGLALMLAGFLSALAGSQGLGDLLAVVPAALVLSGGLALVVAPWIRRVLADAEADRGERARAEARADMAAHLHDSVLQTLTLIQNRAGEPEVAAALAHQQERELRRWLYGVGHEDDHRESSLRAALEAAAAEVEDQYLKIIECVVVGDAKLDDDLAAVVAAAREAMVNASKFAEISLISVYAEVTTDAMTPEQGRQVAVFVRDRGVGFVPELVPADRHGISDSIRGRVERVGGAAAVRSTVGRGTEVALTWPS